MEKEVTGKKSRYAYYDGELVMVKKLTRVGNSWAVILPQDWIRLQGGVDNIKHVLIEERDRQLIITTTASAIESGEL